MVCIKEFQRFNPFKPEFAIVTFIHYCWHNSRLVVVDEGELKWITIEKISLLIKQFDGCFFLFQKLLVCWRITSVFIYLK